ncbi:MAG: PEP-CTERM sorting domain-containing protein [Chthoniobacterales bacterium]
MMKLKIAAAILIAVASTSIGQAQVLIAGWDFTGENGLATSSADVYSTGLDSSSLLTRGATAPASAANNSFRTTGFMNNGISVSNTDYFEFSLSASGGNMLSLSSIDIRTQGTASFFAGAGVSQQFAYSLDGINFTLIGSPGVVTAGGTVSSFDLSGVAALQNVGDATTITLRYYASGQTTTGGWGFFSSAAGDYGLSVMGSGVPMAVVPEPATYMLFGMGLLVCAQQFRRRRAAVSK